MCFCVVDETAHSLGRRTSLNAEKSEPSGTPSFTVRAPKRVDVHALETLYDFDYVEAHRHCHGGAATTASREVWADALGRIEFDGVLADIAQNGTSSPFRLVTCVEDKSNVVVGYVLGELREKGPKKHRQFYTELVNIVVRSDFRSCGAAKLLFSAFREELARSAPKHSGDVRLYVAEQNKPPTDWYRRLGFKDSGWQAEIMGGEKVLFRRMIRNNQS